jgi:hypothetical protein
MPHAGARAVRQHERRDGVARTLPNRFHRASDGQRAGLRKMKNA